MIDTDISSPNVLGTVYKAKNQILIEKCVTCRKLAGRPYTAPLVKACLQQSMPFEVTNIDFTGAMV